MNGERKTPRRRFKEFQNAEAWEQRKIGDVADIVRGASPRPIQDPKWFDNENSEIGWLRISDVTEQNGRIHFLEQRISKEGQEKTRVLLEPHLLLSIAATVGKPVINYVKTGVHDGFLIFLNPKFDREYMFQYMEMFRSQWQQFGQPGSQVNLNSEIVRNAEIYIPTFKEQQEIGNFFTNLDNLITLHQGKLEKLKALKKAYLTQMFPAEGECKPKLRFAGFSDEWERCKLGELVSCIVDNRGKNPKYYCNEGIPVIDNFMIKNDCYPNLSEATRFLDEYLFNNFIRKYNEPDDILITLVGNGIGNITLHPPKRSIIIQNTLGLRFSDNKKFMFYSLLSINKKIKLLDRGMAQPSIRQDELLDICVYLPSDIEQRKISRFFYNMDKLITLHQQKLEKIKNIKKAYLNEMFI